MATEDLGRRLAVTLQEIEDQRAAEAERRREHRAEIARLQARVAELQQQLIHGVEQGDLLDGDGGDA